MKPLASFVASLSLCVTPSTLAATMPKELRQVVVKLEELFQLPPPSAPDAERSLLGCLLMDARALAATLPIIGGSEAFYDQHHAAVFDAIRDVVDSLGDVDLVVVADMLEGQGVLEDVGGLEFLSGIVKSTFTAAHAPYYARILREKNQLRKLIQAAGTTVYEAYHAGELGENGAAEVVERSERRLSELVQVSDVQRPVTAKEAVTAALTDTKAQTGPVFTTGFWEIDRSLDGLRPGDFMVIAARPGVGKTSLALCMADQMCGGVQKLGALFVSRETQHGRLMHRMLSVVSGVPAREIRRGGLKGADAESLEIAAERVGSMALLLDDRSIKGVSELATAIRLHRHRHQIDVVFVDYLQRMQPPSNRKYASGEERVASVSEAMKDIALSERVAVVCLAQLNREVLKRDDTRPRISDLRGSGNIEQDADIIALGHRAWLHLTREQQQERMGERGVTALHFDKVRDGDPFSVVLEFHPETTRFTSLAARPDEDLPF